MDANELRALADALHWVQYTADWQACDQAADYLRAQADAQPVAVPAGWKWVPVEPTPEMLSAAGMMDGYDWHAPGCSPDADHANWYSAMLAAAPAAPPAEPADRCRSSETPDPKATGRSSPERPASNREDAAAMVAAGSGEQAEPKREPLSDERIAEIQRAAYERAAQECDSMAYEPLGLDVNSCIACADAIRALGRQHD